MSSVAVAIIGAGPYGLSLAAHLAAQKVEHRIFGHPMRFWSDIARAGGERYLKSYCFGTNISAPTAGYSFADYNRPRGLETFEPCSMENFAAYGSWFQENNVSWLEQVDAERVERLAGQFAVALSDGSRCFADHVVIAIGLTGLAYVPSVLRALPADLMSHTSQIASFAAFKGREVGVIGAGQSALEAAALLNEAGALPQLLVREQSILWQTRVPENRSIWRRIRSPISGLGTGPKAWALTNFPGAMHWAPERWRTSFVKRHLPAEGAWWLRSRVENKFPVHLAVEVVGARETDGRVTLELDLSEGAGRREISVDHVIAGSGYDIKTQHLSLVDEKLRSVMTSLEGAPKLDANFESSVSGLHFIGPTSAMSFGPLFRFVVGAEYTARVVSTHLAKRLSTRS